MPLFLSENDMNFIHGINRELVNEVIETPVILYAVDESQTTSNLYNESTDKVYKVGIEVNALISHDDQTTQEDGFGPNVFQNVLVSFHRETLREKNFYPERGDLVKWNDAYYELNNVIDNQLLAGRVGLPHSVVCAAHMTGRSTITIRQEG
jgi:hypothetical protein